MLSGAEKSSVPAGRGSPSACSAAGSFPAVPVAIPTWSARRTRRACFLGPPGAGATAPSFLVAALRDPGTVAHPGTPLQRVQIVKGWLAGGEAHQQVFDVAGDPDNGATVDDTTCVPSGPGADSLCTVWTDPSFDPAQHAFYYARVLENPTCRWSTYACNALPPAGRPASCTDANVPHTIQERAWTSPIWYQPEA